MRHADFTHVRAWVFDLDNTLYPPEARLFDQIEVRMASFMMQTLGVDRTEAHRLRKQYWARYGTTLAGLMAEHGVDPGPYLTDVHQISFDNLTPAPDLATAIAALPGRRIVYTNGSSDYAAQVLDARGLSGLFDAVYGIEEAGFRPKPERAAFECIFARDRLDPAQGAMFEDDTRNLAQPKAMGMRTVHVGPSATGEDHVDHHTTDLTVFLEGLA